jgi:hypothetical protein
MDHVRIPDAGQALSRYPVALAIAALFLAFVPSRTKAQIAGRVIADDGWPLSGVAVELWAGTQRAASRSTSADGTFTLSAAGDTSRATLVLIARKIGFRPVSLNVDRQSARLTIALRALAPILDEIAVNTAAAPPRDPCSRTPTAEAAAIFARAASFYRPDTRWLDRIARYVHAVRSTHLADRDSMFGLAQRGGWTRNAGLYDGPAATNATAIPRRLSESGRLALRFPAPEKSSSYGSMVAGWSYPRFHEWESPSFVSRAFVDSMPKSIVRKTRQGIVLAFCPRRREPPYTSGEVELGRDSTIISIRWQFVMPSRVDDAGGLAIFAAPESKSVRAHLLPANAITWTRVPNSDRFETTEYTFGRWLVAEPGDSVRAVP